MICKTCEQIEDINEASGPYVVRNCKDCGRPIKLRELGSNGIGLKIRKDDQVVVPAGWLKIAANPLKGRGQLTKAGLDWFAYLVFANELEKRTNDFSTAVIELENEYREVLKRSPLLAGIDADGPNAAEAVFNILSANKETAEWWLYQSGMFLSIAEDAIKNRDAPSAAWAVACAERFKSLYVFKEHFADVVWMGHSAKRLTDLILL